MAASNNRWTGWPAASIIKIGLVCLPLTACAYRPAPPTAAPGLGFLIVALGDSYASGQGAPDEEWKWWRPWCTPRWDDKRCNRSRNSATAQAAEQLRQTHPGVEEVSFACSGARIEKGLIGPYDGSEPPQGPHSPLPPQVDELQNLAATRKIDAVTISIGGNDIYFAPLVAACLIPGPARCALAKPIIEFELQQLRARLDLLAQRLSSLGLDPWRIFVTEYPDPTHDRDGAYCNNEPSGDPLGGIDEAEAQWASEYVLATLSHVLCEAAKDHGWTYVSGIATKFDKHGWCAGQGENWINTIRESLRKQRHFRGGMHPNIKGHAAVGERLADAISPLLGGQMPAPTVCGPPPQPSP